MPENPRGAAGVAYFSDIILQKPGPQVQMVWG